jgi:hypothetical protein
MKKSLNDIADVLWDSGFLEEAKILRELAAIIFEEIMNAK